MRIKKEKIHLKKTLENRDGITLVALVISIVILVIISAIVINSALGNGGLIQKSKEIASKANSLDDYEKMNSILDEFIGILSEEDLVSDPPSLPSGPEYPKIKDFLSVAGEDSSIFSNTTLVEDDLGNLVVIPGGFHLDKDSATKVEDGIVIEDGSDNQFVWIPVGDYYVIGDGTIPKIYINELSRRTFTADGSTPVDGDNELSYNYGSYYGEGDSRAVATNITVFKASANKYNGFYIGRYEQGEGNVVKAGATPYVNITRDEAMSECETMYSGNNFVISELTSSYAWDTAFNFICQTNDEGYLLATTTDEIYGNIGTTIGTQTGEYEEDNYSNICDMLGNCREWTTEYSPSRSIYS